MDRIKKLCSYLDKCETFADVACDHGYCTEFMLGNRLCGSAVISDISPKCLKKAEILLAEYISSGICRSVCCDGLTCIDNKTSQVLIAGIGGDEIIKILKNGFIPRKFVLQPMKNARALRLYLLENGCNITCDDIFSDGGKYYFIIKGERCGCNCGYTEEQLSFGRDSLNNPVFYGYLSGEIEKKKGYLAAAMSEEHHKELEQSLAFMQEIYERESK